jgi:hypothetical protein
VLGTIGCRNNSSTRGWQKSLTPLCPSHRHIFRLS